MSANFSKAIERAASKPKVQAAVATALAPVVEAAIPVVVTIAPIAVAGAAAYGAYRFFKWLVN